ncbi:MAG TPA: PilZ domain-containing protein [Sphingopyxis sp.]|nr:PilZ domain-containing protein [Sphingopyxis sp.]
MTQDDSDSPNYRELNQRISPRSDIYYRLPFETSDGPQDMAICVNISSDGLLMRHMENFEPDTILTFHLPVVGARASKVIWSINGKTGVQFSETINERDYIALLQGMDVQADQESTLPLR